jgi:hypothetical protein
MKLKFSEKARIFIEKRFTEIENTDYRDFKIEAIYQNIKSYIPVLLILIKKYTSVVANPPYMGQKNMNADLKNYVNANYPKSKSDLFAIFMEAMIDMLQPRARVGCITMESWMFLSSYERLRKHLLDNYSIASLAHFGWHIIGIAFGTATLILEKSKNIKIGEYSHLTIDDVDRVKNIPFEFPKKDNGRFARIAQTNFSKIPGSPIAYWVSKAILENYSFDKLNQHAKAKQGLATGENNRFLRNWSEVSYLKIGFSGSDESIKWFPCVKGGSFRRWYGNNNLVVNWASNGHEIKNFKNDKGRLRSRPQNLNYYFKKGFSWSTISSGKISFRYTENSIFETKGSMLFPNNEVQSDYLNGFVNSSVFQYLIAITSPTMDYHEGPVGKIPFKFDEKIDVSTLILKNLEISKKDWNAKENSWDFEYSPLLNTTNTLEEAFTTWQEDITKDFFQLHSNEEELNRIFIAIYGLQDELTPEVALKDITILQEELAKKDLVALEEDFRATGKDNVALPINKAEVVSQFISYAIGLFMGRYRLDKKGLNIAHPNPTVEELENYNYNNGNIIIDEDAILPLMGTACNFPDDALQQIYSLLDAIWGADTRAESINFIQDCLNKDVEKFLVTDFYKYHCKMYKKKPIYWLFSSKKGAFQVLVYMHRMNAFTVEKIRDNYLLEHIKNIVSEITLLENNEVNLNTQEAKKLEQLRKNREECYEYEADLKDMADKQITFDLDDGVTENYKKFETVVAKIK